MESDGELLRLSRENPAHFEAIFDRYHALMWSYVARVAGRSLADELTADVFVAAFTSRSRYDPARGPVRAWLYGIAANLVRTHLRSEARMRKAFDRAVSDVVASHVPIDAVDDSIVDRQLMEKVANALRGLPANDREVLLLFAWEQLSYEEIASALGVEIGTVRSRLSRARERLRALLGDGDYQSQPTA